jgi:hypothetical protein
MKNRSELVEKLEVLTKNGKKKLQISQENYMALSQSPEKIESQTAKV